MLRELNANLHRELQRAVDFMKDADLDAALAGEFQSFEDALAENIAATRNGRDYPMCVVCQDITRVWERRARTADELAVEAKNKGDHETQSRCKTKAGMLRSLASELRQNHNNYG